MTVAQLIAALEKLPPNMLVVVYDDGPGTADRFNAGERFSWPEVEQVQVRDEAAPGAVALLP